MLTLPAFAKFDDATVFQDDHHFNKFYVIPESPGVRRDKNDKSIFLLVKYKFSDESREDDPDLPDGGGYLAFDAQLDLDATRLEEIKVELQEWVDTEWERLKTLPDDTMRTLHMGATFIDNVGGHWDGTGHEGSRRAPGTATADGTTTSTTSTSTTLTFPGTGAAPPPADAPPPPVVLGEPLWRSGTVRMLAPQSAGLITHRVAEAPAAMIGGNVASFNMDLTPDGATFFEGIFLDEDRSGGSDLAPIQIIYELKMLAKVPPATARIKLNTASTYHALQELFHEHTNCTDDYFTSENMMTQAMSAGLVTVQIDAGGVTDEDIIEMLMQQAMGAARDLMTERFATKEHAPLEEWGDGDIATSSDEIYRLKQISEVEMSDFEQTIELSSTIEHSIAPQGTMQTFFGELSRSEMKKFVRVVDLNDKFFRTLDLRARAIANWAEDDVALVELEVKYGSGADLKTNTFTFTANDNEVQEWDPGLNDAGDREYQYRFRIGFNGREPGDFSRWDDATSRDLNIIVPTPGKLRVDVNGAAVDFENIVSAVLVHMRYEDSPAGVDLLETSVLLASERQSGTWEQLLFTEWDKPLEYRFDYLLKNGKRLDGEWTSSEGKIDNLIVPAPNVDQIDITLVPSGHWSEVVQSVVTLKYVDEANEYHRDATYSLKTIEEFKKWSVLLLDSTVRQVNYEILTTFSDGFTETTTDTRDGDGPVEVHAEGAPKLRVGISGAVVDFALTPVVKVEMSYRAPTWPTAETHAVTLTTPEQTENWVLDIPEDAPKTYTYKVTYFPIEGDPVEKESEVGDDPQIVVPRYTIPRIGGDFHATLIDFAATPAVEVNLRYDDPERDVHETGTLVFTGAGTQSWLFPIEDGAPRSYAVEITYHLADGDSVTLDPKTMDKRALVLPRYRSPAE